MCSYGLEAHCLLETEAKKNPKTKKQNQKLHGKHWQGKISKSVGKIERGKINWKKRIKEKKINRITEIDIRGFMNITDLVEKRLLMK